MHGVARSVRDDEHGDFYHNYLYLSLSAVDQRVKALTGHQQTKVNVIEGKYVRRNMHLNAMQSTSPLDEQSGRWPQKVLRQTHNSLNPIELEINFD